MDQKFTEITALTDINNGAVMELFDEEFQKLLNNLADENTSWKTQREVTIKLKVKLSNEMRDSATTIVDVSAKLAPPKANESIVHLDSDGRNVSAFHRAEPEQPELTNIITMEEAQ